MSWQEIVVLALVVVAAVYVARQTWREWAGAKKGGCGGGCGCASAKPAANEPALVEQLTVRKRE